MSLEKCTGGGCETDADINTQIGKLSIQIPFVNTYFDFDDYNDPVKTYIDDRLQFATLPTYVVSNSAHMQ